LLVVWNATTYTWDWLRHQVDDGALFAAYHMIIIYVLAKDSALAIGIIYDHNTLWNSPQQKLLLMILNYECNIFIVQGTGDLLGSS
jgi:hypothetical protein